MRIARVDDELRDTFSLIIQVRPRQDSNLRSRLRRAVLYPLSYGGSGGCKPSRWLGYAVAPSVSVLRAWVPTRNGELTSRVRVGTSASRSATVVPGVHHLDHRSVVAIQPDHDPWSALRVVQLQRGTGARPHPHGCHRYES